MGGDGGGSVLIMLCTFVYWSIANKYMCAQFVRCIWKVSKDHTMLAGENCIHNSITNNVLQQRGG